MKLKPDEISSATSEDQPKASAARTSDRAMRTSQKKEIGGTNGPEPTRYGDWEHKGIASDF